MNEKEQNALRTARALIDLGHPLESVLELPLIPPALRDFVRAEILRERNLTLIPARTLVRDPNRPDWVSTLDRSHWRYWPELRQYLLRSGKMNGLTVRSLDDSSDRVLRQLEPPWVDRFDVRGLVLGYVQSGKTANFTALAAKAADAGYRFIVVLSGVDNGLRRQTNQRLKRELVGFNPDQADAVPFPPIGYQWHEFTQPDMDGDFRSGLANAAALQGNQPVLVVVKKNGTVLRRLRTWLRQAPGETLARLPVLVIDDEADLASIDTRGSRGVAPADGEHTNEPYEPPSIINGLIRDLLNTFRRKAYVAYTATPFANVLIPHDVDDPSSGNDLYPRDFIIDLPKPPGYFGAEEIFGIREYGAGAASGALDVLRAKVSDEDLAAIDNGLLPASLETALLDFILAGAGRAQRGQWNKPTTMLIHTSPRIVEQSQLCTTVSARFSELRDEWRYQRGIGIRSRLEEHWEKSFRPITRQIHPHLDVGFPRLEKFVGPMFEAVEVREINSQTGAVLDYEREPSLKAIAIGGNRLSRGLTLDGLTTSYFVRESPTYDTLMQMGRWFGFRDGYDDLTRIWTTKELAGWFSDLAFAERQLRDDLQVYEVSGMTPLEVGVRIWQHPSMQITAPLKRRFAASSTIRQSYSLTLAQTFRFPFGRPAELLRQSESNLEATRKLVASLGTEYELRRDSRGPIWSGVPMKVVKTFLEHYQVDPEVRSLSLPLVLAYLENCASSGELASWTVAIRGRGKLETRLGTTEWGIPGGEVPQVSRSRLANQDSLGVITDSASVDEATGFSDDQMREIESRVEAAKSGGDAPPSRNSLAREIRPAESGLLLLYPISRYSTPRSEGIESGSRSPLFDAPDGTDACDLIGIALSLPKSNVEHPVEAYLEGTVRWRPVG